jgi:hypothetical protein
MMSLGIKKYHLMNTQIIVCEEMWTIDMQARSVNSINPRTKDSHKSMETQIKIRANIK